MIEKSVLPFKEDVVKRVADEEWRTWKDSRKEKEDLWYEILRAFHGKHPSSTVYPAGRSKRFVNLTHQATMNIHSHLMTTLFPHENFFQVVPENIEDEQYADQATSELLWLMRRMGFYDSASSTLLQNTLLGFSPYSMGWDTKWSFRTKKMLGLVPYRKPYKVFDGPKLITRDAFNCVWDIDASEDDDQSARISRTWRSLEYLKQMSEKGEGGYRVYEGLEELEEAGDFKEHGDDYKQERLSDVGINDADGPEKRNRGRVEILERWGDFEIELENETRVFRNYVIVIANRSVLIRFEPNPIESGRIPLQRVIFQKDCKPNDAYGIGAIEPGMGLQDATNKVLNQFMDLVRKQITGQHKYLATDPYFDPDNFEVSVDSMIPVGDMNNIMPILQDHNLFNIVQVYGLLKAEFEDVVGSVKNFTTPQFQKSATEINFVASIMAGRFKELIRHHESTFVTPLLEGLLDLRRQFGPEEQVQRQILGADGQTSWKDVDAETFDREFSVKAIGSGYIAQREERLQRYTFLLQVLGTMKPEMLQAQGLMVNIPHLVRKIYQEFGFRDDDQVLVKAEPVGGENGSDTGGDAAGDAGDTGSTGESSADSLVGRVDSAV
jgi:hypothetical protein